MSTEEQAIREVVARRHRATVLAALLALTTVSAHAQPAPAPQIEPAVGTAVRPFRAQIPDQVLDDLRRRLAQAKWPDQLPDTRWEHGADISAMRKLAEHWQKTYDWRKQEAEVDGQRIHFIHQRSPRADAIPLQLIHGWPGSIVEFLALIEPLTKPKDASTPAFHVIVPSLLGFGFSGPTKASGWDARRTAEAFVVLMDRLGYSRYGIQGGDWGSGIASVVFRTMDGEEHHSSGEYREVVPDERLVFTWEWGSEPDRESLVTIMLRPISEGTSSRSFTRSSPTKPSATAIARAGVAHSISSRSFRSPRMSEADELGDRHISEATMIQSKDTGGGP